MSSARRLNSTQGDEQDDSSPSTGSWFHDRPASGRRLRHRPDRRGAVQAGVRPRQRRAAGARHAPGRRRSPPRRSRTRGGRPAGPCPGPRRRRRTSAPAAARRSACRRTSRSRGSSTGRRTRSGRTGPGRACSRAIRSPSPPGRWPDRPAPVAPPPSAASRPGRDGRAASAAWRSRAPPSGRWRRRSGSRCAPCSARQPCGVSVSARAVTYFGAPSAMARPLRWQRSSAASAVMNGGRQRGTKLCRPSSVHRQPKAVLTSHSSSPAQASSWAWISPVKWEERVRKQASCRPAGSTRAARSGAACKNQTWARAATAMPSGLTASPMARSKLWYDSVSSPCRDPDGDDLARLVGGHEQGDAELAQAAAATSACTRDGLRAWAERPCVRGAAAAVGASRADSRLRRLTWEPPL